jgi:hypothetical protein
MPVLRRPVEPAPYEQTLATPVGMSQRCQNRTLKWPDYVACLNTASSVARSLAINQPDQGSVWSRYLPESAQRTADQNISLGSQRAYRAAFKVGDSVVSISVTDREAKGDRCTGPVDHGASHG